MGNFNRGGGFGGRGGRDRGGRDRDRGPKQMHTAVCDNCGNNCEVPFKPTSGKPIYCDNCFSKMKPRDSRPRFSEGGGRDRGGNQVEINKQLESLNKKLDQVLEVLSQKAEKKPAAEKEATTTKKTPAKKTATAKKTTAKKTTAKKTTVKKTTTKKAATKKKK